MGKIFTNLIFSNKHQILIMEKIDKVNENSLSFERLLKSLYFLIFLMTLILCQHLKDPIFYKVP